jgi:small subunit ribosomal protein S17e
MGRVKTKNIKKTSKELLEQYPDEFSDDFVHNKEKVDEFTTVQSKSLRNKIAGYIVALKRRAID